MFYNLKDKKSKNLGENWVAPKELANIPYYYLIQI